LVRFLHKVPPPFDARLGSLSENQAQLFLLFLFYFVYLIC